MIGCSGRYSTWDARVGCVEVRDGFTTGVERVHLVVRQSDGASPASRTPGVSDGKDVDATLALRVHASDTAADLLTPVERVSSMLFDG